MSKTLGAKRHCAVKASSVCVCVCVCVYMCAQAYPLRTIPRLLARMQREYNKGEGGRVGARNQPHVGQACVCHLSLSLSLTLSLSLSLSPTRTRTRTRTLPLGVRSACTITVSAACCATESCDSRMVSSRFVKGGVCRAIPAALELSSAVTLVPLIPMMRCPFLQCKAAGSKALAVNGWPVVCMLTEWSVVVVCVCVCVCMRVSEWFAEGRGSGGARTE